MMPNIIAVRGNDLVPHDEKYFSDFSVHPNDEGFVFYGRAIAKEIKKHLNMR